MNTFQKRRIMVMPEIPKEIKRLEELAYNLWWSWNREAWELFRAVDEMLWEETHHNPIKFLMRVECEKLDNAAKNSTYMSMYNVVLKDFDDYMKTGDTWFNKYFAKHKDKTIAYFSAEFGFHEALPIYSGGLGILAGDHCKSASDLGLPFVGVSLLYREGYFKQRINKDGDQKSVFEKHRFREMPMKLIKEEDGSPVLIEIDLPEHKVYARIWQVNIGRIKVYLLDADHEKNGQEDRAITQRLYGGDQEMRIKQEILLGMGGVRALDKLGIQPDAWHMNEGHSVFLGLERIRDMVRNGGLNFFDAIEAVRANTIFTTHTPVPAGNDAFPLSLKEKYFKDYWEGLGLQKHQFMELGMEVVPEGYEVFSLTKLAFRLSGRANGVSKLHGEISREIWKNIWPGVPAQENMITHITNGVHFSSWIAPELKRIYDRHLGIGWENQQTKSGLWESIDKIADDEIWDVHMDLKRKMISNLRNRLKCQMERNGELPSIVDEVTNALNEDALIMGFARRFATYKRAMLIFSDIERAKQIFNDPARPVQLIFAGKAHPADEGGQKLIKDIIALSKSEDFRGKVFFIEDYDIEMARYLVMGVDVWLNNPRRPHEASGTSGQKAALNGVLNCSILDGWWVEGYDGKNGWAIGSGREFDDSEFQDIYDAEELYNVLEKDVIPTYYTENRGRYSKDWVELMKGSLKSVPPYFNTDRMVQDYVNIMYAPAIENKIRFFKDDYKIAKDLNSWKNKMLAAWNDVYIQDDVELTGEKDYIKVQKDVNISVKVHLGKTITPEDVTVEVYFSREHVAGIEKRNLIYPLVKFTPLNDGRYEFKGILSFKAAGYYDYSIRVIPAHKNLIYKHALGLIKWLYQ